MTTITVKKVKISKKDKKENLGIVKKEVYNNSDNKRTFNIITIKL